MGKSRPGIAGRIGTTRVAPKPYWPELEDDDFDVTKPENDEFLIPIANVPPASPSASVKENQPEGEGVSFDETTSTPQRSGSSVPRPVGAGAAVRVSARRRRRKKDSKETNIKQQTTFHEDLTPPSKNGNIFDRFSNSQQEQQQTQQQQPSLKRKRDQALSDLLRDIHGEAKPVPKRELDPSRNVKPEDIPTLPNNPDKISKSVVQCVEVANNGNPENPAVESPPKAPPRTQLSPIRELDPSGNVKPEDIPTPNNPDKTSKSVVQCVEVANNGSPESPAVESPPKAPPRSPLSPIRSDYSFNPKAWKRRKIDTGPISNVSDRVFRVLKQWPALEKLLASMRISLAEIVPSMTPEAQACSAVSTSSTSHVNNDQLQQHNHQDESSSALQRRQQETIDRRETVCARQETTIQRRDTSDDSSQFSEKPSPLRQTTEQEIGSLPASPANGTSDTVVLSTAEYKRLTGELHQMKKQYEASQEQNQSLVLKLEDSTNFAKEDKQRKLEHERQMTQLQQAREALKTTHKENTSLTQTLESVLRSTLKYDEKCKAIEDKTLEISELRTSLNAAKEENAALKLDSATSFLQDNQQQMISDQQELYQLQKALEMSKSKNVTLKAQLDSALKAGGRTNGRSSHTEQEVNKLRHKLDKEKRENAALQRQLDAAAQSASEHDRNVSADVAWNKQSVEERRQQNGHLEQSLQEELNEKDQTISALKDGQEASHQNYKDRIEELLEAHKQKDNKIGLFEAENQKLRALTQKPRGKISNSKDRPLTSSGAASRQPKLQNNESTSKHEEQARIIEQAMRRKQNDAVRQEKALKRLDGRYLKQAGAATLNPEADYHPDYHESSEQRSCFAGRQTAQDEKKSRKRAKSKPRRSSVLHSLVPSYDSLAGAGSSAKEPLVLIDSPARSDSD
jgi:hypothetical protein